MLFAVLQLRIRVLGLLTEGQCSRKHHLLVFRVRTLLSPFRSRVLICAAFCVGARQSTERVHEFLYPTTGSHLFPHPTTTAVVAFRHRVAGDNMNRVNYVEMNNECFSWDSSLLEWTLECLTFLSFGSEVCTCSMHLFRSDPIDGAGASHCVDVAMRGLV